MVYTSIATTDGRHFWETLSASVAFSSALPLVDAEDVPPSTVVEPDGEPLVTVLTTPVPPSTSTHASAAPANAIPNVFAPEWFFLGFGSCFATYACALCAPADCA